MVWNIKLSETEIDEIVDIYVTDENIIKSFCRWYGDWLIGSGVYATGKNLKFLTPLDNLKYEIQKVKN